MVPTRLWHLLLVGGVALALRLGGLDREPLTVNEATSMCLAKDPWNVAVSKTALDVHPPLHYLFLNIWTKVFGYSETSLRMPSVAAGALTAVILWWWAHTVLPRGAALIAGLIVAISPFHVHYSQEARFYGFLGLEAALFLFLSSRLLWTPSRRVLLSTIIVGLAGLYTHYYFGFWAFSVWLLCGGRSLVSQGRRNALPWLAVAAGLVIGYAPWLLIMIRQFLGPGAGSTGPIAVGILQHTFRSFLAYGPDTGLWRVLSFILVAATLGVGLVRWKWVSDHLAVFPPLRRGEFLPTIGLVLTAFVVFVTGRLKPLYIAKGMVIVLPAYAVVLANAWERLRYRPIKGVFIGLILLSITRGLIVFYDVPRNKDWRGVADLLTTEEMPGDVVGLKEGLIDVSLHYYYHPVEPEKRLPELLFYSDLQSKEEQVDLLLTGVSEARRFWLVRDHPPNSVIRDALTSKAERFSLVNRWDFTGGVEVYLFDVARGLGPPERAFEEEGGAPTRHDLG